MKTPFTTLHGHVKYMRPSMLNPVEKMAMEFAFAAFFADEQRNEVGLQHVKGFLSEGERIGKGPLVDEEPYKYRRFSGGAQLPRGRYFTVARADGTTRSPWNRSCERTSITSEPAGSCSTTGSRASSRCARGEGQPPRTWITRSRSSSRTRRGSRIRSSPGWSTQVISRRGARLRSPFLIRSTRSNSMAIDLRLPGTQRWLYENVAHGLPGVGDRLSAEPRCSGSRGSRGAPDEKRTSRVLDATWGHGPTRLVSPTRWLGRGGLGRNRGFPGPPSVPGLPGPWGIADYGGDRSMDPQPGRRRPRVSVLQNRRYVHARRSGLGNQGVGLELRRLPGRAGAFAIGLDDRRTGQLVGIAGAYGCAQG